MRAVILLTAVAFSTPALCEAPPERISITIHSKVTTPIPAGKASPAGTAKPSVYAKVPRYQTTWIAQHVEADGRTCNFMDDGKATPVTAPQFGEATYGAQPCTIPADYPTCAGRSYPSCAAVYYKRTAHNNKSIRAPSADGPVDIFTYHWKTKDNYFNFDNTLDVAVPAVHPIGETVEFKGFYQVPTVGFYGKWVSKLMPPSDDPDFDFEGDTVKESHFVRANGCQALAPRALGDPSKKGGIAVGTAATWKVGEYTLAGTTWPAPKNYFGFDLVGWSACTVQAYRCAGVTEPYCGTRLRQTMHHHAQSDYPDFFVAYQDNELGEEIGGRVLPDPNPNKTSIGFITSSKNTTQTLPNAVMNLTYCPFLSTLKDRLPKCFDSSKK